MQANTKERPYLVNRISNIDTKAGNTELGKRGRGTVIFPGQADLLASSPSSGRNRLRNLI